MTNHLTAVPGEPAGIETFETWMRTHARPLRRMCARLLRDDALAEDIVQETLLRAWTRRDQFAAGAEMGPWLRCVARNLCIEHLRTRGRMIPSSDALPDHPDHDADPTAPLERAEEHRSILEALSTLSDRHRALLVARDIEGVDYAELARREGLNEDAARAVLFRARRTLRDRYIAATRAIGAAVLWIRIKTRTTTGRMVAPAMSAAGASIVSAAAASLVVVIAAVAAVASPFSSAVDGERLHAEAAVSPAAATVQSSDPAVAPSRSPLLRGPAGTTVTASADRAGGTAAARATARNPITGGDEYVWTRVWREQGGDDSVALTAADEAADAACAGASEPCEALDEAMKDPGGLLP